jgi:hypothetical protein
MAPPLMPCWQDGGPGLTIPHFRNLFEYVYIRGHWYAPFPRGSVLKVRFTQASFDHAFFKEHRETMRRTEWQPDRAQRFLWIGLAIERPTTVCCAGGAGPRYYLFCRLANDQWPWYLVVVEETDPGVAVFITAFPLDHDRYKKLVKEGSRVEL